MAILIFADGASSGNPGPSGWGALVVFRGGESQRVHELGGGEPRATNNRMELMAVTQALRYLRANERELETEPVEIYTDSTYVIQGITRWIHGWRRNGWKTKEGKDVVNRELWEELEEETRPYGRIHWNHVAGHAGIPGNERVDAIAVAASKGAPLDLYSGPLEKYPVRVLDLTPSSVSAKKEKKTAPSGAACYLSLVDGTLARHATWSECEKRVKGVSGARFKKISSPEEEKETLRAWGLSPE